MHDSMSCLVFHEIVSIFVAWFGHCIVLTRTLIRTQVVALWMA
jgi:hypothetical protein